MLIVLSVATPAAVGVVAYNRLRQHSPEAGTAGLRAVRDLADVVIVVIVCVKALEGVVNVPARPSPVSSGAISRRWAYGSEYDRDFDLEDEQ